MSNVVKQKDNVFNLIYFEHHSQLSINRKLLECKEIAHSTRQSIYLDIANSC